mmetsp:Transcript_6443/g.12431  ORF Transcript_6443/g.12431 Transcript_6443/m.12431 type:complete len:793 (-) Transcript_6443:34-2412(-)|eukprot:CAMPEP_0196138354 /NCGR_PEP_ID=MMETSP0910-20130528/6024_1 /TAXON_ID=49265 /ORGANISM="Thalassiosira rotula, Strain GSO102" /LENGTH=792 /DNA_ID=CAMNT_0041398951 /DNA_START=74 /DNA_END=2452 /DNA_ORIENTATION=+
MSDSPAYDRWSLRDPSTISYGYYSGSNNNSDATTTTTTTSTNAAATPNAEGEQKKGFYITTAINYTNGPAHMGHAYEGTTTDAIARFARLNAKGGDGNSPSEAYFVTGADEHGEKIAKTAEKEGKQPLEICDKYVTGFQCLNQRTLVSNDDYVRTTSARHKRTAQALWLRCAANDDIYLSQYSGWYNVKEETFVTDNEAELCNYCDASTGQPLQKVQEASYFFRMSKYHERLVEHIENNAEFIRPEAHRNLILARLNGDKLRDLSVSRTTFTHGISVPEGFDSNHVMYVWFDALTNYLTGVDALGVCNEDGTKDEELAKLWPADVHIIGKDILWFHTVIWPCILMSAGLPLPKTVFAHGFVNDKEGKKMSKSVGNVVDPHDMLDLFDVDSFRWYLCKEAPYGGELSFSEESMRDMHNADLVKTLGNLVQRATKLCGKYCDGAIPDVPGPDPKVLDFDEVRKAYVTEMEAFALEGGANVAIQACRDVNGYLTKEEPWKLKGDEFEEKRRVVVRATLEAVYAVAHLLLPFIPRGASEIFKKMNTPPTSLWEIDAGLRNLAVGTKVDVGDILYEVNLSEEERKLSKKENSKNKKASYEEAQRLKKERKAKEVAASKAAHKKGGAAGSDQPEFTKIDIRVGQITKVWHHPEADKLFCEEIDLGEEGGPRQIASGLREHYTLEDMLDRKVLVVCNLKAAKIVGFSSNGMVLAAKSGDGKQVELVSPPADAPIGERVFIDGLSGEPASSTQVKKKKIWESVSKKLKTGERGVATWDGKEVKTSVGVCAAASLVGSPIS